MDAGFLVSPLKMKNLRTYPPQLSFLWSLGRVCLWCISQQDSQVLLVDACHMVWGGWTSLVLRWTLSLRQMGSRPGLHREDFTNAPVCLAAVVLGPFGLLLLLPKPSTKGISYVPFPQVQDNFFFFFCFHFPSGLDFCYMEKMDKHDLGGILCPFHSGFLGIPISPLASDEMYDMIHSGVCNHYPPPSSASPRAATLPPASTLPSPICWPLKQNSTWQGLQLHGTQVSKYQGLIFQWSPASSPRSGAVWLVCDLSSQVDTTESGTLLLY